MKAALLTWFIIRPDDGPVGTETCSLPCIKYDVPDVDCFIILVIIRQQLVHLLHVGLLRLISLQHWLCFADFSLGLPEVMLALRVSLMLVRKANPVEEETIRTAWLYHQRNQYIHVTDGVPVASLSPSLLQKISAATYRLCQIASNRKLARKFAKRCKFSRRVKAKSRKNNSRETIPACKMYFYTI
jgi:hypothetical protein